MVSICGRVENIVAKRCKCLPPVLSPLATMFSKAFSCKVINPLPHDKVLDCSKLKAFAVDKINDSEKLKICFEKCRKRCGKRRKCCLPAFSPFPTMFSIAPSVSGSLTVRTVW